MWGVSLAGGDGDLMDITEDQFDNICRINLRGTVFACKHAVAIMREQGGRGYRQCVIRGGIG